MLAHKLERPKHAYKSLISDLSVSRVVSPKKSTEIGFCVLVQVILRFIYTGIYLMEGESLVVWCVIRSPKAKEENWRHDLFKTCILCVVKYAMSSLTETAMRMLCQE